MCEIIGWVSIWTATLLCIAFWLLSYLGNKREKDTDVVRHYQNIKYRIWND